jgi:hypothetical protein
MSNADSEDEGKKSGPNLVLIYGLIVLGFLVAFAVAAMIVWPFYVRR